MAHLTGALAQSAVHVGVPAWKPIRVRDRPAVATEEAEGRGEGSVAQGKGPTDGDLLST
jgi:hypothetical protein